MGSITHTLTRPILPSIGWPFKWRPWTVRCGPLVLFLSTNEHYLIIMFLHFHTEGMVALPMWMPWILPFPLPLISLLLPVPLDPLPCPLFFTPFTQLLCAHVTVNFSKFHFFRITPYSQHSSHLTYTYISRTYLFTRSQNSWNVLIPAFKCASLQFTLYLSKCLQLNGLNNYPLNSMRRGIHSWTDVFGRNIKSI